MNYHVLIFLLFFAASFSECDRQYEQAEDMGHYTALDLLSAAQSVEIDRIIFDYMNAYSYISMGLVGEDGAVLIRSYGADRLGKTDVYASVSKPVCSMIFFQMLEKGMIKSVDDSIGLYADKYRDIMPERYRDSPVTFRHLLAHQSGIPHHERIWEKGKLALEFEPGTSTLYSTRAYGVLGEVLCEIAGLNYNQLVKTYIGEPVGAGSFSAPSFLFEAPGGLVRSTIADMTLFAAGILDDLYVNDSLKKNLQWEPCTRDQIGDIGMGWYLNNYGTDSLAVFHAGSNGKPRAFIALRPEKHLGVVLQGKNLSPRGSQRFYELAKDLMFKMNSMSL